MPDTMIQDVEAAPSPGRSPVFRNDQMITIVHDAVKEKPLKAGKKNFDLFEKLKEIAPVSTKDARAAGIPSGYIEFYQKHGLIKVSE